MSNPTTVQRCISLNFSNNPNQSFLTRNGEPPCPVGHAKLTKHWFESGVELILRNISWRVVTPSGSHAARRAGASTCGVERKQAAVHAHTLATGKEGLIHNRHRTSITCRKFVHVARRVHASTCGADKKQATSHPCILATHDEVLYYRHRTSNPKCGTSPTWCNPVIKGG